MRHLISPLIALVLAACVAFAPAVIIASTASGCAGTQLAGDRAAAVDCTTAQVGNLVAEFGPAVGALVSKARGGDGTIDTAALKKSAASLAVKTGACVLAEVLANASSATKSFAGDGPPIPAPEAKATFAAIRDALWPGTQYFTSAGSI